MKETVKVNVNNEATLSITLEEVERLAREYSADTENLSRWSLHDLFEYVSKKIKYKADPKEFELVMRPKHLLKKGEGDCDDKTVFILSVFYNFWKIRLKGFDGFGYSIVSQSTNRDYHHIFPFIIIHGKCYDFDATYPQNIAGQTKRWSKRRDFILKGAL